LEHKESKTYALLHKFVEMDSRHVQGALGLRVAGRLRCVQHRHLRCQGYDEIHPKPGRTPPEDDVQGRGRNVPQKARDGICGTGFGVTLSPTGRKKIAHRFIGGSRSKSVTSPVRDERNRWVK